MRKCARWWVKRKRRLLHHDFSTIDDVESLDGLLHLLSSEVEHLDGFAGALNGCDAIGHAIGEEDVDSEHYGLLLCIDEAPLGSIGGALCYCLYNTCTCAHESGTNYTVDTVESESKFNTFPQATKDLRVNVYGCASSLKMFEMKINIKSKCSSRNQREKHPAANPNP